MAQLDLKVLVQTKGEQELDRVANKMSKIQKGLVIGGAMVGAVAVAGLADAAKALIEIERLNAQTAAVIRSTGGAANVSLEQIEGLAEGLERTTTVEREVTQEAANMLLTFTRVRNEAGKGNDVFDQTTKAALNMSVALGTDAKSAAMQLGKALQDPAEGLSKLARAGIQFSTQQKRMIRELQESGDLLGAQKIILAELETQFGGSAEAFADTTAGKIQRFQNDVGNMFESIVLGAAKVADALGDAGQDVAGLFAEPVTDSMVQVNNAVAANMGGVVETMQSASARIREDWEGTAEYIPLAIAGRWADTRAAAFQLAVEHAKGVLDGQNQVKVAFEALTQLQEEEQTKAQRIAYLQGVLSSTQLAAGLKDPRAGVSAAARALKGQLTAELAALGVDAYNYGLNITKRLSAGMLAEGWRLVGASETLAKQAGSRIHFSSPPPGPLHDIDEWGSHLAERYAASMLRGTGAVAAASESLAGSVTRPGLIGGTLAGAGSASVGPVTNIYLTVEGDLRAKTPEEVIGTLQRLAPLVDGKLAPGW
jgi:hypothetical protein